jgi:hypothetical protein
MDADDVSNPDRLRTQLDYLDKHLDTVMLGTQVAFIAGRRQFPGPRKPVKHDEIQRGLRLGRITVCHAACMFRTSALRNVGGYRIQGAGQDIDLFLRMCEAGRAANVDAVLYQIRVHAQSVNCVVPDQVARGRAYAIECASCREKGSPEPSVEEFNGRWRHRSVFKKAVDGIDRWSTRQFRKSLIDIGESRAIAGALRLGCAALCRPGAVARRVRNRLRW